jgi:putative NIF3 family GTP cyclohydrolase 1 type 2
MITTPRDLERTLIELCGAPLNADEGLKFGDANAPIRGIINCWTFNAEVAEIARRENCNLILSHEALFVPYGVTEGTPYGGGSGNYLTWPANLRRAKLLIENDLQLVRFHGNADKLCVFQSFAEQLGLSEIHAPGPLGYDAVFHHAPLSIADWIMRIKERTGMETLRASFDDPERTVTKIGLGWGGMALFVNLSYPMKLIELGAELVIAGETDNYGFRFVRESGADIIECSHEVSENRGIAKVGDLLRAKLPDVKIVDFCNPCIWSGV